MKLADLIDLEWLLRPTAPPVPWSLAEDRQVGARAAAGRGLEPAAARSRLDDDLPLRRALCLAFLAQARQRLPVLPGARVEQALRIGRWLLAILGAIFGAGAASALLAYDGTVPVNVLHFAGFFIGLQLLLLGCMLWFVVRARRPETGGGPGFLLQPLGFLLTRLCGAGGREALAAIQGLEARAALHRDVQRWTLFALAQWFGVAFNVAAVATALLAVTFSDRVFAWSTTLAIGPATVHTVVEWVALPWAPWDAAVPSLAVVASSQWDRMQGAFVAGPLRDTVPLAAQWWRFLVVGLCVWGLLPRISALTFGALRARSARARATLDHAGFQALYARLLPPDLGWQGPAAESVRGPAPARTGSTRTGALASGAPTWVVLWGSMEHGRQRLVAALRAHGVDVREALAAGGADLDGDAATLAALRRAGAGRVLVACAAGQQPTGEVLEFLQALRKVVGRGKPLTVALLEVGADGALADVPADERAGWQRSLDAAGDPHLGLGTLGAAR